MKSRKWQWAERPVDRSGPHIELAYRKITGETPDHLIPVALVGHPSGNVFPVQFLLSGATPAELEMLQDAKRELDFYLTEHGHKDPWEYALYHCTTAANIYSSIHWSEVSPKTGTERRFRAMAKNRFSPEDTQSLRSRIFQVINEADAPVAEVLKALSQCHAHIENRMIVEQTLKECGLRPSGFIANEHLELYYDIAEGKREVGYICKGWEDPGFRVGDLVQVPREKLAALTQNAYALLKYCATRGVAMTVKENDDKSVEVQMESVIYSDGFNKKVFEQVLRELNVCVEKAHNLIG